MIRTMYALLAVLMIGLVGQAQQPQAPKPLPPCVGGAGPSPFPCDDSMFPAEERRIPQGDYCKRRDVTIRPNETHAHPCDCTYSCTVDEDGNVTDHESSACQSWCKIGGRRCTCHPEGEPGVVCTMQHDGAVLQGNAIMDMNGTVLAVHRP